MKEIWKDIEGYEGHYQVSNFGQVRRWKRKMKKWYYLKSYKINSGYLMVGLCRNNKHHKFTVHRLVAIAFIPNPHNHPCVNHKDGDRTNNCVDNLEWCTYQYNNTYNGKHCGKQVFIFQKKDGVILNEFDGIMKAAKYLNISPSGIANALTGRAKSSGGYQWEYKN